MARFHQPKNLHLSLYTKKFEFFHPIGRVPSIEDSQYVGLSLSNKKCGLYHLSYGLNHLLLVQHLLYLHYWSQPPPSWSPSTPTWQIAAVLVTSADFKLELKFVAVSIHKDDMAVIIRTNVAFEIGLVI